ncbi:hypothetical protein [Natrinema limicola]|uniref:hypothetical protein n=1 Tax=Natrinema limicola TaxID=370323 RepID=UPI000677ECE9|nr:hypothetical protein [Natrinema limicola]
MATATAGSRFQRKRAEGAIAAAAAGLGRVARRDDTVRSRGRVPSPLPAESGHQYDYISGRQ